MKASALNNEYKMPPGSWCRKKLAKFSKFLGNTKDCLKTKLKYCVGGFQKSNKRGYVSDIPRPVINLDDYRNSQGMTA